MSACGICGLSVATHHYIRAKAMVPQDGRPGRWEAMPDEQHLFFGYSPPGHSCKSPITGISACPVAGVQCQGHELEEIEAAIEKDLPPRSAGIAVRLLWNPPMTYVRKEGQWAKVPLALPQGLGVDVRNGARGFIAGNREALAFGLRALVGEG